MIIHRVSLAYGRGEGIGGPVVCDYIYSISLVYRRGECHVHSLAKRQTGAAESGLVMLATHLVRSKLVDQVMHVDEENTKITNLLVPLERERGNFFCQSINIPNHLK